MRIEVAAATHAGKGRTDNEDCLYVDGWLAQAPDSRLHRTFETSGRQLILAVIDGMGGHTGGAVASVTAGLALTALRSDDLAGSLGVASRAVLDRGQLMPAYADMGATVAGVLIRDDTVVVFNAGDSRVYRMIGGFLGQLSIDDLVPDPTGTRKGLISQALGGATARALDPHEAAYPLESGTALLLCSDGLHDYVERPVIAEALGLPAEQAVSALIDATLAANAPDNVSVIVAKVNDGS